jgi:biotin operon repressor
VRKQEVKDMPEIYTDIKDHLKNCYKTEDTAISAGELATLYNLTKRGIRAVVTVLRQEGYPICSSNAGYWYSTDPDDIRKTANRLEAQAVNMMRAVEGLRKGERV